MKVLSLFDESGVMVRPWVEAGVECTIVDALHPPGITEGNPRKIGTDLSTWFPDQHYDVIFAFPPCTLLCRPASQWWYRHGGRDAAVNTGMELVNKTIQIIAVDDPMFWMIENPTGQIPKEWRKWDYKFHPAHFGGWNNPPAENYTKETCLWFSPGFPELERREAPKPWLRHDEWISQAAKAGVFKGPGTSIASKRSKTPTGLSYAVFHALYPLVLGQVGQRTSTSRKVKPLVVGRAQPPVLLQDVKNATSRLEYDLIMDQIREAVLYNEISSLEYYEALQVPPPCDKIAGRGISLPSKAKGVVGAKVRVSGVKLGPLGRELMRLREDMAKAAQEVYDNWQQEEDGTDWELGMGGICDRVSEAMSLAIEYGIKKGIPFRLREAGGDGDDHSWLLAFNDDEMYEIDIPPSVYETGGGYAWKKRPGVEITEDDVIVHPQNRKDYHGDEFSLDDDVGRKRKKRPVPMLPSAIPKRKPKGHSVGSAMLEEWEDPQTTPARLLEIAKKEPRAYQNPNMPWEGLFQGSTHYPWLVEANTVIPLLRLEDPSDPRLVRLHNAIRHGWKEQGGLKILSERGRRLYLADCVEMALQAIPDGEPYKKKLKQAIQVARYFTNNKSSLEDLRFCHAQVQNIATKLWKEENYTGNYVAGAVSELTQPVMEEKNVINGAVKAVFAIQDLIGFENVADQQLVRIKHYIYLEHPELKPAETTVGKKRRTSQR